MLILHRHKLAFLAVPKTGSTAIEMALSPLAGIRFLQPPGVKHMTHQRFNRFIRPWLRKEGLDDVELFAVVREPVSWLGSWYRYRRRDELAGSPNSTRGVSFDAFVRAYLQEGERPAWAALGSQLRQLSKSRDTVGIDHLFRYEQMDRLLDFLEERTGTRPVLPRRNVSPEMELSLSPETAALLREKRAGDFALWEGIGTG